MWYAFLFFLTVPLFLYIPFFFPEMWFPPHPPPLPFPFPLLLLLLLLLPLFIQNFFPTLSSPPLSSSSLLLLLPKVIQVHKKKNLAHPPPFPSFHKGLDCCLDIRRRGGKRVYGLCESRRGCNLQSVYVQVISAQGWGWFLKPVDEEGDKELKVFYVCWKVGNPYC